MKKSIKVISILLVAILMIAFASTTVMASNPGTLIDQMQPTYDDTDGMTKIGQKIANYLSTGAVIVALIVLLVLGIKYMIGSASEKAEYKKTMIPYLVGAFIVFGAGAIVKVIVTAAAKTTAG